MQINRQSYEEFFLLYTDGELDLDEKRAVEDFIKENPDLEHELILMQQTVALPDESIVFEDKELLYRKEENRKVIPWFRLSAAAVLLIAFSILGWLFLDHPQTVRNGEMASANKAVVQPPLQKTEPPVVQNTVAEEPASPSETIAKKRNIVDLYNKSSFAAVQSRETKSEQTEKIVKPAISVPTPDPAQVEQGVVKTDLPPVEDVNVPVVGREIKTAPETALAEEEPSNNAQQVQYVNGDDNDMIYFANTSLPKKTKLRGVLRKATRILDKVTSFQ
jgi:hypothetical protein